MVHPLQLSTSGAGSTHSDVAPVPGQPAGGQSVGLDQVVDMQEVHQGVLGTIRDGHQTLLQVRLKQNKMNPINY